MDRHRLRVLLVDDDEDDYLITRDLLAEVVTAAIGLDWVGDFEQARALITRGEHAVYLIDYRLGARNGLDLVRAVLADGCRAPLIVLTGQGDDEVGLAAMQAGAADYLSKGQLTAPLLERAIRYAIERKRAEEGRIQLIREQAARAEAEAAVRARDQFLSIAAHELKTPLTSLFGNIQLLQRRALHSNHLAERDLRIIRVIVDQTARLNRMIEALLDISRLETGQLSIDRQPVDLDGLVRRVVEDVRPSLDQHTLELACGAAPLLIDGDELRLEQVIQNLIGNAIKYSPAGGPVLVSVDEWAGAARVRVTDQGIGIPAAALPHLFHRFYRADNANARHISGMGVGLFVVAEIVELHGGRVEVESCEGQGSTFTVLLPLTPQPATAALQDA